MTSGNQLEKMAALAYIEIDTEGAQQLAQDVSAIMHFVGQLRQVDTTNIQPLLHPLDLSQRLRNDDVDAESQISALSKIAPVFTDGMYRVPKVIETGK